MKSTALALTIAISCPLLVGCAEFANTGSSYPYGGGYQGYPSSYSSGYDNSYERRELERERWRLEQERREIQEQRRDNQRWREDRRDRWRDNHNHGSHSGVERVSPPPPKVVNCPSGFSPRGSKCSDSERSRGCRDSRHPGGSGYCIGW